MTLIPDDLTTVDGIPCTAVARTLVDLGDVAPIRAVERAVEQSTSCAWRAQRLAVETDTRQFHRTRQSRERDARRDQLLRLMAFEPVRFTGRQVAREPGWVKACLSELIARRQPLASRADGDGSRRAGAQAA